MTNISAIQDTLVNSCKNLVYKYFIGIILIILHVTFYMDFISVNIIIWI